MEPGASPTRRGFAAPLLDWFEANRRPLPWRRDRDPYRIWVAEVLLQQTRVAQATPYYERFLARFPDLRALAAAPLDDVRKAWEGAGYYARARRLWEAARLLVRDRGGRWPTTPEGWRELPGVGPYTANAVASLAFGAPVTAVDANALRVAARWEAETRRLAAPGVRGRLEARLAAELPPDRSGAFNEAVMELGERICRPGAPDCGSCPVRSLCRAFRTLPDPGRLPTPGPVVRRPHHEAALVVLERDGRWLVQRRPERGLLAGLWEFPGGHRRPGEAWADAARRELFEETGWRAGPLRPAGLVRHQYSHFSVTLHLFTGAPRGRGPAAPRRGERRWVTRAAFERLPRPTATRKAVLRLVPGAPGGASRGSGSRPGRASPSTPAAPRRPARRSARRAGGASSRRSRARR